MRQPGLRASSDGVLATKSERKMLASTCLYSLYAWLYVVIAACQWLNKDAVCFVCLVVSGIDVRLKDVHFLMRSFALENYAAWISVTTCISRLLLSILRHSRPPLLITEGCPGTSTSINPALAAHGYILYCVHAG